MMEKNEILRAVAQVTEYMLDHSIVKATKFISPKHIVRAVRKQYGKKINTRGNIEVTLTIGRPNYAEREFIKTLQKAKEPFPVKNVLLKHFVAKKRTPNNGKELRKGSVQE